MSCLSYAAQYGDAQLIRLLLRLCPALAAHAATAIYDGLRSDGFRGPQGAEALDLLLDACGDVEKLSRYAPRIMHLVCARPDSALLSSLLKFGLDRWVATESGGRTPWEVCAATCGRMPHLPSLRQLRGTLQRTGCTRQICGRQTHGQ